MTDKHHRAVVLSIVVTLGLGLHFAFKGLAGELPKVFPQLTREKPKAVFIPMALQANPINLVEPSPSWQPQNNLKSLIPENSPKKISRVAPRITQRLVRSTSIPATPVNLSRPIIHPWDDPFEVPAELRPIVGFWQKIYAVYDSHHVVFHDMEDLSIEYSVLDFTDLDARPISDSQKSQIRQAEVDREMERLRATLDDAEAPEAKDRIRSQTGLKDRFAEGIKYSGRYIPLFEEIFESYGLPKQIAYLPFVESLFRERAYSKVGAGGLWQFMPSTASRFIAVNRYVDERYDPILATHAAARLLLHNFEILGTWPLAINAYNSGAGNLQQAINRLGTRDITKIITGYKGGSYAFASRNFYPSFLAAKSVYQNYEKFFGPLERKPLMQFDLVQLPLTLNFTEIAYLSDISLGELQALNPAFSPSVFEKNFAMPAGSQIRVPVGKRPVFTTRFVDFSGSDLLHVVKPSESVRSIASLYEVSSHEIERANEIISRLETGKVLRIPHQINLVRRDEKNVQ